MRKIKLIAKCIKNDKDFRKLTASIAITTISVGMMFVSSKNVGKKIGAEMIIQAAEEMQPGFRKTLKAFAEEHF